MLRTPDIILNQNFATCAKLSYSSSRKISIFFIMTLLSPVFTGRRYYFYMDVGVFLRPEFSLLIISDINIIHPLINVKYI